VGDRPIGLGHEVDRALEAEGKGATASATTRYCWWSTVMACAFR